MSLSESERQPLLSSIQNQGDRNASEESQNPASVRQIFSVKLFAVMICFFMNGLATTAVGALISGVESFYNITDGPTAFIFPAAVSGYLCATGVIQKILVRYGWRGLVIVAILCKLLASLTLSTGPPLPLLFPAHLFLGIGLGLLDSGFCAWGSKGLYANIVQGCMHGSFSVGAVLGPVFGLYVTQNDLGWYTFYRLWAMLLCIETIGLWLAFRQEDATLYNADKDTTTTAASVMNTKNPFLLRAVWTCGTFFFLYVGIESSFSDWAIEFMKRVRHLDPALASLSSSIFWIGMTLGRFCLGPVTETLGLERCVSIYITLSILFQFIFKFTSNTNISLALLGANGFCLGPMYPSGIVLIATKVSSRSKMNTIAAVNALGQLGGASAPLAIGLLADRFGIKGMLDVVLGLSGVLLAPILVGRATNLAEIARLINLADVFLRVCCWIYKFSTTIDQRLTFFSPDLGMRTSTDHLGIDAASKLV